MFGIKINIIKRKLRQKRGKGTKRLKQTLKVESKEGKKKCGGGEQELPSGKKN